MVHVLDENIGLDASLINVRKGKKKADNVTTYKSSVPLPYNDPYVVKMPVRPSKDPYKSDPYHCMWRNYRTMIAKKGEGVRVASVPNVLESVGIASLLAPDSGTASSMANDASVLRPAASDGVTGKITRSALTPEPQFKATYPNRVDHVKTKHKIGSLTPTQALKRHQESLQGRLNAMRQNYKQELADLEEASRKRTEFVINRVRDRCRQKGTEGLETHGLARGKYSGMTGSETFVSHGKKMWREDRAQKGENLTQWCEPTPQQRWDGKVGL